ncbi:IS3 family transposase [Enterococcus avium]|uniref:IS3 family transposase n=1 Tax=Enterococcus avium TaxID=33945 RepID=UPI000FD68F8C|nr:IS3 family transposase [Enterococcus avium]
MKKKDTQFFRVQNHERHSFCVSEVDQTPYSERTLENMSLAKVIRDIHDELPEKGYRSINDILNREHDIHVNDKRVLRICRHEGIQSTIKHSAKYYKTSRSTVPHC